MAKDVTCGMTVDEKTAKFKSDYMGKTYYFCSQMCKTTFDKDPAKYTGGSGDSEHSMGHSSCGCGCC